MENKMTNILYPLFFLLLMAFESYGSNLLHGVDPRLAKIELEQFDREEKILVPMRDGVNLSADVIFPKGERKSLPVILIRTPYSFESNYTDTTLLVHWLKSGYAVMYQYERGTHWSEGRFDEFLWKAKDDGFDTIEWISEQTWSNGRVGTYGCSSPAENQLGLATLDHPAHKAMIPVSPGAGIGQIGPFYEQGAFYRGGVWQPFWLGWYSLAGLKNRPQFTRNLPLQERVNLAKKYSLGIDLPQKDIDYDEILEGLPLSSLIEKIGSPVTPLARYLQLTPNDPYWKNLDLIRDGDRFGVPALWIFSWYDVSVAPSIELYNYVQKNALDEETANNQFMVISPGLHCSQGSETKQTMVGDRDLGDARFNYLSLYTDWFDHWLKGKENKITKREKVQIYTMGDNEWRFFKSWPVKNAQSIRYYLDSDGNANSRYGSGRLQRDVVTKDNGGSDEFVYDPANPVRSRLKVGTGGLLDIGGYGPFNQAEVESRHDVLVYSSAPLEEDVNVTGPIEVELYVSSNVIDTDFTVKLVDVEPDGTAYQIDDSIQRVRYREGYDKAVYMERDKVYKINIGPMVTSNVFKSGHRIRIEISSSNFPKYARNLNTGGDNVNESKWQIAQNRIHHSARYPSHITIPVVLKKTPDNR